MKTCKQLTFCFSLCMLISIISFGQQTNNPIRGTYKTIYDMLKDVPGIDVKSNNGKGGTITVRGTGSLTQQGQPLFVLDGSVYSGDIGDLNPEDIESISVLKDAASQTAYGTRAMFGVIVIASKNGKGVRVAEPTTSTYSGSAYSFFIEKKMPLKVYGQNDEIIIEGVIQKQVGDTLIFLKKRKDFPVPISSIKRVELKQAN